MSDTVQIATFSGGELSVPKSRDKTGEAALALPLDRLIVRMVRVPEEGRADPCAYAKPLLQAMSPFPDEELTVSCETVRETASGLVVIAGALPEGATDDIGEALDGAKLNVTRVDAIALGRLREIWKHLSDAEAGSRRLVLMAEDRSVALLALDDGQPSAIRAIPANGDFRREVMLSLLEAEDFGGERPLKEIVVLGEMPTGDLETFAPVRRLEWNAESVVGLSERAAEPGSLDMLPSSWREMLEETRFKARLRRRLAVAGAIWALAMGVLFGVPMAYGFMTAHQKGLSKEHQRKYREVVEMRDKTRLVQKYSDHSRGALEILKAVSDRLPEAITLNSWNFKRDDGVRFSGESDDATSVYSLKDRLIEIGVFADVQLNGPSAGKGGKQKFDINCLYAQEEE